MLKSINGLPKNNKNIFSILLKSAFCITALVLLHSCGSSKYSRLNKKLSQIADVDSFANHSYGILVYDPKTNDTLINQSSDKYFIPASNVKIPTLYTALKLLPDSLPAIKYQIAGDTIFFKGLGDPSLLHNDFQDSTIIKFLKQHKVLYCSTSYFDEDPWPPGWSWEDFDQPYAIERSSLPVYGNRISIYPGTDVEIRPILFKDSIEYGVTRYYRDRDKNIFYIPIVSEDSLEIPMRMISGLEQKLLSDELATPVLPIDQLPEGKFKVLNGSPRDTVLRKMMIDSDNFLAEQLLLNASSVLGDTLSSKKVIEYMLEHDLNKLNHMPRWVDGSGLSRYNLFTPASLVDILNRIHQEYGWSYTLSFFPKGGLNGTLENHFKSDSDPYVFAKSGTLGNTYCLSGYLKTKSGNTLIFSIMNNNFRLPQQKIKMEIEKLLIWLRDSH